MAGSLNHVTAEDGSFRMDLIENGGDAHEALEECHQIIAVLLADSPNPQQRLDQATALLRCPMSRVPVLKRRES